METLQAIEQTLLEKTEARKLAIENLRISRNAVSEARETLAANDYKRHKNIEYAAVGLELPYPWEDIHRKSQELRDIINEHEPKRDSSLAEINALNVEIRDLQRQYAERKIILEKPPEDVQDETDEGVIWSFEIGGTT